MISYKGRAIRYSGGGGENYFAANFLFFVPYETIFFFLNMYQQQYFFFIMIEQQTFFSIIEQINVLVSIITSLQHTQQSSSCIWIVQWGEVATSILYLVDCIL